MTFIVLIQINCILFTDCRVWYLVLDEGCCPVEDEVTCACCCGCWLRCTCVNTCACVAGCVWPCCCLCTFCMCHFWEDVWNLVLEFHTTACCTTGTVSRGSKGRCFFNVLVEMGEELLAVEGVVMGRVEEVRVVLVWAAVRGIMLSGTANGDWDGSLTVGEEERTVEFWGWVRLLEIGVALPVIKEN